MPDFPIDFASPEKRNDNTLDKLNNSNLEPDNDSLESLIC